MGDIDLEDVDLTSREEKQHETKNNEQLGSQKIEYSKEIPDEKARELEEIKKQITRQEEAAREKAAARATEAKQRLDRLAKPAADNSAKTVLDGSLKQQEHQQKESADIDISLIQRCLRSVIPSIAATTGTDILES